MDSFFVIALGLAAGIFLRRFSIMPDNASNVLNLYVIWFALPALILTYIPAFEFELSALLPMLVAWSVLAISAMLVLLLVRWFGWSRSTQCVLLLLVPLGNTSFVGIPMVNALIGEEAIPYAVLYDQLGSFLALATYGSVVIAIHSSDGHARSVRLKQISQKVISFPPFIALLVAVGINLFQFELLALASAFQTIGATLVPVVMVAVGFQWQFKMSRSELIPMVCGLAIKLLLAPLIVYLVIQDFDMSTVLKQSLILESAMAPMISAGALAILANQRPSLVAAMIGYGLLAGFVTVPLWYWWLN